MMAVLDACTALREDKGRIKVRAILVNCQYTAVRMTAKG